MGGKDEEMPARGLPCMPHYSCYITYNFSRNMYTCSGATEFFSISLSFITKTIDGMEQTKHTCKYVFILLHLNHCHNVLVSNCSDFVSCHQDICIIKCKVNMRDNKELGTPCWQPSLKDP